MDDSAVPGAPKNRHFSQPDPKGKLFYIFWSPFRSLLAPFWIPFTRLWLPLVAFWLLFGALWLTFAPPWAPFSHFCGLMTSFLIFKKQQNFNETKLLVNQIVKQFEQNLFNIISQSPTSRNLEIKRKMQRTKTSQAMTQNITCSLSLAPLPLLLSRLLSRWPEQT